MKKNIIYSCITMILIGLLSSCTKNDTKDVVADPDGTITVNLNEASNLKIYEGPDPQPYDNYYPYMYIFLGMSQSNLNTNSTINVCPQAVSNWQCHQFYNTVEVANLGNVDGLGNITTKPGSGYSSFSAIQKGCGYVIRYKKTHDQSDPGSPYFYARFYVVDWLTSATTGGVLGATIHYQGPF